MPLRRGELLQIERPGGGGLGSPLERPMETVLNDVRQGYVSRERARTDYGVVLEVKDGEPFLNEEATQIFRGEKQKTAGNKSSPLV
jgi:N-methylhydantoinase B